MHSTNYTSTLILVSDDCRASFGTVPPKPGTVAAMQYELLANAPYTLTSDDMLTRITTERQGRPQEDEPQVAAELFSKGQACTRASPLVKTYGWGIHHDAEARMALISRDSPEYERLLADDSVTKRAGMRSRR